MRLNFTSKKKKIKKRHFYVKKAVFLQIERLSKYCFFTKIYFCIKAAFLQK